MTAPTTPTEEKELQRAVASSLAIDAILARSAPDNVRLLPAATGVAGPHPLEGVDDVAKAKELIAGMLEEERTSKKIRQYPRTILRQQHIVAYMLVNPFATSSEICGYFDISPTTLSNIAKSDTFKAMIGQHKASVESIAPDIQDQLRQLVATSIEVVGKAVVERGTQDAEFALAVMDKAGNRMGLGAKHNTVNIQNNNIVTPDMIAAARSKGRIIDAG